MIQAGRGLIAMTLSAGLALGCPRAEAQWETVQLSATPGDAAGHTQVVSFPQGQAVITYTDLQGGTSWALDDTRARIGPPLRAADGNWAVVLRCDGEIAQPCGKVTAADAPGRAEPIDHAVAYFPSVAMAWQYVQAARHHGVACAQGQSCAPPDAAVATDHNACLFGSLAQNAAAPGAEGKPVWDNPRPGDGDAQVQIVYRIADLTRDPTGRGRQVIEFGVLNRSSAPARVRFVVVVTSNTGRWYRYHFGLPRVAGLGEESGGATLSKQPFPPDQCIARVNVTSVQSAPAGP